MCVLLHEISVLLLLLPSLLLPLLLLLMCIACVQLRGMLSGDDASKEQIERQVLHIWDKIYKNWFAKVCTCTCNSNCWLMYKMN